MTIEEKNIAFSIKDSLKRIADSLEKIVKLETEKSNEISIAEAARNEIYPPEQPTSYHEDDLPW